MPDHHSITTWLGAGMLAIGLVMPLPARSEVTLHHAVTAAYERHPERALAAAERDRADALRARAGHALAADPAFNLRYDTDAVGSGDGYREWEGGVELPLWWPGQPEVRLREAQRTADTAVAMATARRLEVAGEVRERLWAAALARSAREESRIALASARKLERDIARRVEAGELPRSDLVLAQRETVAREDALEQAANRVRQAARAFTIYTGLDTLPPVRPEDTAAQREVAPDHPRLALAEAAVAAARAHRDRVAGERRGGPSLWLGGKRTRDTGGADYASSVALEVSIPFGSEAHAAPALAAAEAQLTGAVAERDRTRRELAAALERALLEQERTRQALERAQRRQTLADESLRLAVRAFELGETDLVRLLQVREDTLAARQDLEARRLELGQASARLNQALGVIPQ